MLLWSAKPLATPEKPFVYFRRYHIHWSFLNRSKIETILGILGTEDVQHTHVKFKKAVPKAAPTKASKRIRSIVLQEGLKGNRFLTPEKKE